MKTIYKNTAKSLIMFLLLVIGSADFSEAQWQTSGNNIYYNTGNVGIGTSSPASKLTTYGYGWNGGLEIRNSNYSGYYSKISDATDGLLFRNWGPSSILFSFRNSADTKLFQIFSDGHVEIGNPPGSGSYKLNVGGNIRANEIVVNTSGADYVFNDDYQLRDLNDLSEYVKENKHLPDIPTAKEMKNNGVSVGKLQTKLLQKVEELTLYIIELKKNNEKMKARINEIERNQ